MMQLYKTALLGIILCFVCIEHHAQTRWKKYDSIYYERIFSPTFSTMMMPKGYVEVIINNSILTANQFWDNTRNKQDLNSRTTYYYTTLQTNMGVSPSGRISFGVDLYYAQARRDVDPQSSPLNVFNSHAAGNYQSDNGLTAISPRLKIIPSRQYKNLIFQTALVFPLIKDITRREFLGQNSIVWNNQLLYSVRLSKKFISFAQADIDVSIKNSSNNNNSNLYYTPVNIYAYCLLTKHIFPFASIGYAAVFQNISGQLKKQLDAVPAGIGLQYQYSLRFNVNVFYTQYVSGQNYNDWKTLSLGLRGVF